MSQIDRQNLRLVILQILYKQPGYVANETVIQMALKQHGIVVNRDQLHLELSWLDASVDCLVDQISGGVHIANLSGNGMEVVEGSQNIPGIRRPRPDEIPV